MNDDKKKEVLSNKAVMLTHIALWQFLAFAMLLCIVWVTEVLDLPALLFGVKPSAMEIYRAATLSAAVLLCAIIAVGNTYTQQRHILKGLMILCSACRKVKVNRDAWQELDKYLERYSLARLGLDVCPECFSTMKHEVTEMNVAKWKADTGAENI